MVLPTFACWIHFLMAASRLDMFWAEATDVDAAIESPTKSARESLFAYLMNSAPSGYVDLTPYIIFWFLAQRQCLAPKHLSRFMSTRPRGPYIVRSCKLINPMLQFRLNFSHHRSPRSSIIQ